MERSLDSFDPLPIGVGVQRERIMGLVGFFLAFWCGHFQYRIDEDLELVIFSRSAVRGTTKKVAPTVTPRKNESQKSEFFREKRA